MLPGDPGYDSARAVYNAQHDRHPAMVVRAADVADVIAAVRHARDHDLLLAVRGGGHSIAGFSTCDRGMVLDLGALRGIRIDPAPTPSELSSASRQIVRTASAGTTSRRQRCRS